MNQPPSARYLPIAIRPWAERIALSFVLLTLATLVVGPFQVQRRVSDLRREIETSEPSRTQVMRLQLDLVREREAVVDAPLIGAERAATLRAAAHADEQVAFQNLLPLATRLGADVASRVLDAQAITADWHSALEAGSSEVAELALFENVRVAIGEVDRSVLRVTALRREQIEATERKGLIITVVMGILAVAAAAAAAELYRRVQRFATESEERRVEAEQALEETARANEARVRLLRGVTHDVKNPLGAAKGYAELLALGIKAPVAPEQAPLLDGVRRSIDNALEILSDLLDVARADGGGLTLSRVSCDLATLVQQAVEDYRAEAEAAGLSVEWEESSSGPIPLHSDPGRIAQILGNLLSNAVKFTPSPGRIQIWTGTEEDVVPRTGLWAVVRVNDSGPGIPAEMREVVFDDFTRLEAATATAGHGLGLAISRRLARLLGGDLRIDPAPDRGATFSLWLPLRKDDADPETAAA